jgi:hypothetical protein
MQLGADRPDAPMVKGQPEENWAEANGVNTGEAAICFRHRRVGCKHGTPLSCHPRSGDGAPTQRPVLPVSAATHWAEYRLAPTRLRFPAELKMRSMTTPSASTS